MSLIEEPFPRPTFGLLKPSVDAHTLGVASFSQLIEDCGWRVVIADPKICNALNDLEKPLNIDLLVGWLVSNRISSIGFSYRLDPADGVRAFGKLFAFLTREKLLSKSMGGVSKLVFAGLPETCKMVEREFGHQVDVFWGDETPQETLLKIGVPRDLWPESLSQSSAYDDSRVAFAKQLLESAKHLSSLPSPHPTYPEFGTFKDSLAARINYKNAHGLMPLMRAHVGPYQADRIKAISEFKKWASNLAKSGFLDILSIGSSQLTQEAFGEKWDGRSNGGGVPINSPSEFFEIWEAARPMLVRTYSGTRDTLGMAKLYDQTINNAWHALSLWWFCQTDDRGPHDLLTNLKNHFQTLRYIATTGRPFEPNIPHHFAFRGSDDLTYVVSVILAARLAKRIGIRAFVFQNMLNTPKATWGVQDLAKSRAILALLKPLQSSSFLIYFQPRAGLDYFSYKLDKAKIQLAAVTALMDDIEPWKQSSPDIIHVVSYSEGAFLATPEVVNESIQITRVALEEYRSLRKFGAVPDMTENEEVMKRTHALIDGATVLLNKIEAVIPDTYTPEGFYKIFWAGFLPVPQLWGAREAFHYSTVWKTRMIDGGSRIVDQHNRLVTPEEHAEVCAQLVSKPKLTFKN